MGEGPETSALSDSHQSIHMYMYYCIVDIKAGKRLLHNDLLLLLLLFILEIPGSYVQGIMGNFRDISALWTWR